MMSHAAYERKLEVARGAGSKCRKHINKVAVLHFHSSDHAVVTACLCSIVKAAKCLLTFFS